MRVTTPKKTLAAATADGQKPSAIAQSKVIHSPGKLTAPKGMPAEQKKFWNAVVALIPSDQMGKADAYQLREMVEVWDLLQQVKKVLFLAPLNREALDAYGKYQRTFQNLANQFGLTPVTRRQIEITPAAMPASEVVSAQDTFGEILGRLGGAKN